MSYRLYTLREDHSDKDYNIAIFDGKSQKSSKFYEFKNDKVKL